MFSCCTFEWRNMCFISLWSHSVWLLLSIQNCFLNEHCLREHLQNVSLKWWWLMEQKRKLLLVYSTEELIKYKKKKKKQFLGLFPSAVLSYTIDSSHKIFKLKLLFFSYTSHFPVLSIHWVSGISGLCILEQFYHWKVFWTTLFQSMSVAYHHFLCIFSKLYIHLFIQKYSLNIPYILVTKNTKMNKTPVFNHLESFIGEY